MGAYRAPTPLWGEGQGEVMGRVRGEVRLVLLASPSLCAAIAIVQ